MNRPFLTKAVSNGLVAAVILLAIYFLVVSSISGWEFARIQFRNFWYFISSLATGFGIQVGLYVYLKNVVQNKRSDSGKVLAVSGTTSTAAMISCCAHYLANIVPILGISGFLSVVGQYQIELFWLGLAFNFLGIVYIGRKIWKLKKYMAAI